VEAPLAQRHQQDATFRRTQIRAPPTSDVTRKLAMQGQPRRLGSVSGRSLLKKQGIWSSTREVQVQAMSTAAMTFKLNSYGRVPVVRLSSVRPMESARRRRLRQPTCRRKAGLGNATEGEMSHSSPIQA
jgi:hypothetical protein